MHARVPPARRCFMNPYVRILLPLAVAGLLAACSTADSPSSAAPSQIPTPAESAESAEPMPTKSASTAPSASAGPSETPHDMGDMGGSGESAEVEIVNFAYEQPDITVSVGTTVTFTNLDAAPHTVTAGTDADPMADVFDSGLLQQGESFTFTFEEPGTYVYFCDRHPPMEGSVTVES